MKDRLPISFDLRSWPGSAEASRVPDHQRMGGNITSDHATCSDEGAFTNRDPANDGCVCPDTGSMLDQRWDNHPIVDAQKFALVVDRSGSPVVDETYVRADEGAILDGHSCGDEGERLDLHVSPKDHTALNFNERRDLAMVADRAAVEVC